MVLSLAIASAVSLGVADYLAGETLRRDGRFETTFVYTTVGAVFGAIVVTAALPLAPAESFRSSDVAWSIGAGVAIGGALPLLMIGMARGPMAIVAPVLGLVTLAVPAVAGPLLGDQLSTLEILGLVLAFPAAGLVSLSNHGSSNGGPARDAVLLGTAAGLLFGFAAVCFGQTSTESGVAPGVVAQWTSTAVLATAMVGSRKVIRPIRPAMILSGWVGILTALAVFLSVLAYQRGPVAIVAAVIGLAPGPTVVLARALNHEEIRPIQLAGFVLGVIVVVLFAFG